MLFPMKSRKLRQDRSEFKSLRSSPVTGPVTMPANCRLYIKSVSGAVAGVTAASIVGPTNRTIKTPVMQAGELMLLGYVERASVVTLSTGFELLMDSGLGVFDKIAQGA